MLVLFLGLVFGQVCFQGQVGDLPLVLGGGRGLRLAGFLFLGVKFVHCARSFPGKWGQSFR